MAIKSTTFNNLQIAVLEPRGSIIGGDETDELKQKAKDFLDQGNKKLILDLSNVTYLNSSGIGAVVSIHTAYAKAAGKVKVCGLDKGVKNVFVITSLTRVIDVEETRDDALKNFEVEIQ
ncbi:MAG: STAS domain-containing protein [Ignavibacteriae bacterium]|nr:STAS domain-containing protein [Ignavibacteriota bacterium]